MENILSNIAYGFTGNLIYEGMPRKLGGKACAEAMSYPFKLTIVALSIAMHSYSIYKYSKNVYKKLKDRKSDLNSCTEIPSYLEMLWGYAGFLTVFVAFIEKLISGQAMYMFNPCHLSCLQISYVCVSKRTYFTCYIFNMVLSFAAGVSAGAFFADTTGQEMPFESELFYITHYLFLFGILLLFFSGRYKAAWFNEFEFGIVGFAWFGLWNRIVCYSLSELTWANINYNLCAFDADPFYMMVGNWYIAFCEVYCGILSIFFRYAYQIMGLIIRKTLTVSVMNKTMEELLNSSLFISNDKPTMKVKGE